MKYNKIALIGMMGSGKTTISKLLSHKTNFKLIDLDNLFEEKNNITISNFFQKYGEDVFRQKETELLNSIKNKNNIIISTGGGIILKEENRNILFKEDIFTIYLNATTQTIFNRIKNDTTRPLLLVKNPEKEIEKITTAREQYYKLANITVVTDNKTKEEIAEEIWKKLI